MRHLLMTHEEANQAVAQVKEYCESCGAVLSVEIVPAAGRSYVDPFFAFVPEKVQGYDTYTGKPLYLVKLECPRRSWLRQGHTRKAVWRMDVVFES